MGPANPKSGIEPVALARCGSYEPGDLAGAFDAVVTPVGGLARLVAGKSLLIKPNFLVARRPEQAVNTHPHLILTAARAALEAGASRVVVADSPAFGRGGKVAAKLGLPGLLAPLGVEVVELTEPVDVTPPGFAPGTIKLAREVVEAEAILNLAKCKTHGLCGLTLAVKNCFGAVIGLGKARWHVRCGRDVASFARMLVQVCRLVGPGLSVIDGVVAMDGNGPSAGRPRPLGFLAASRDPFNLDRVVAGLCGVRPEWVATFGLDGIADPDAIPVVGADPDGLRVTDFRMPRKFSGHRLGPAPRFDPERCSLCQQCLQACQAGALRVEADRIRLDKGICIRCYCCQEICPEGAIGLRRRWWQR